MEYQKHCQPRPGLNRVLPPGAMGLKYLELDLLDLGPGETHRETLDGKEAVLTILAGSGLVETGQFSRELGGRADVFSGRPEGAYLGEGAAWSIRAVTRLEAAIFRSPAAERLPAYPVAAAEVQPERRGQDLFVRQVSDLVGLSRPAGRLIVGETLSEPGHWSSYPPHKHDRDNLPEESFLEEVYYFRIAPADGFGFMRLYTEDGQLDQPILLKDRDLVSIPRGFHPVAVAPGYRVYYLWALAGPSRNMKLREDPSHARLGVRKA
ncbi:MAG: 5-deoxy-glucuronate isomerase [candidate division TA06 bacterium ADurb.Bin417]|uniref:5-deoxy-glucuronate isomerase n=1 Tax=candidate division TA06 bacterium ADurb.Bin417 TaxID=1852828 RepID=A0A1V5MF80_UNCT6|nr:MAG: 5-deoxy-glucuronate isomerase [candidate division TA06 bacterium ADurb.Bin417]